MKIETKFDINQRVYIPELKVWGRVLSIYINSYLKYNVRYFDTRNALECYFLENELSAEESQSKLGFINECHET